MSKIEADAATATQSWILRPARAVSGRITVPGDKSISHRALMLGGIATGTTSIDGFLSSEDCLASLRALRALGVRIEQPGAQRVIVHGVGMDGLQAANTPLDMGNAGTAMRLFMGLLAGQQFDSTLMGDRSLMQRPMERVAKPLRAMGARISTAHGKPPVVIQGGSTLHGIDFTMPVASAQVKSAVLLAALRAPGTTRVIEPAPTRDHTERMLTAFGVEITRDAAAVALRGGQLLRATHLDVPGDFSSAAFFLVAASIGSGGPVTLQNVGINPTRTGLLDILLAMGADIRVLNRRTVGGEPLADLECHPATLRGISVRPEWVPLAIDEFPVFFIAAACAQGESVLRGAEELRVKESDRLAVMAHGLRAMGVEHELYADGMRIVGRAAVAGRAAFSGGAVDSHGDHRIAMSFAVASLRSAAPILIADTANVATSFPGFAALAGQIGLDFAAADASVQHG